MSQPISEGESGTVENGSGQARPTEAAPETVLAELEKILSSKAFAHSERHSRFLSFVVEQTLEGKGDQLKEYLLGVEVFHRPPSFDPRIDSTVRTEASRLRSRLKEYYEGEGRDDPILIELLKGSYIPLFQKRVGSTNQIPLTESKTESVIDLRNLERDSDSAISVPESHERRRSVFTSYRLLVLSALGVLLALAGWTTGLKLGWFTKRPPDQLPELTQQQLTANPLDDPVLTAVLSPDGKHLAYADLHGIHLRMIATGETRTLPLPEGLCFR